MSLFKILITVFFTFIFIACGEDESTGAGEGDKITEQQKVFNEFIEIYDKYYALTFRKKIDWKKIHDDNYPKIKINSSDEELFKILSDIMTKIIKDGHTLLSYKEKEINYIEPAHEKTQEMIANITDTKIKYIMGLEDNNFFAYGTLKNNNDIGYIKAKEFEPKDFTEEEFNKYKNDVDKALKDLKDKKGIIIDVRYNFGGQLNYAAYLASRFFATEKVVLQRKRYKLKKGNDESSLSDWVMQEDQNFEGYEDDRAEEGSVSPTVISHNEFTKTGDFQFTKKIAVLTSKRTISSAELFVCLMKSQKHVKSIGNTTFGIFSGSDKLTLKEGNGKWSTNISTQDVEIMYDGKYQSFEGHGIAPDELILAKEEDLDNNIDIHINKAVEYLSQEENKSKKLKIVALHKQLGIENPGALRKMVKHNGKVYLKIMKPFTKEMVWYIYESGKSLTKVTPPNNVLIRSRNKFHYGVNYQGKYYYPVENKTEHALYTFNEGAGTTQKVAMEYPEGFNAINNLIVFNNKLYFTANSKKNGMELFSYTPSEGLKLLPQIADGYLDKDKRFPISSHPTNLFLWNNYLVFSAQDDKRPDTGKYGRELYKLDKKGNISILNDFLKGSKGSEFSLQTFLSKQTGQTILYNYATRKFYVLNNDFSITDFSYGDVANSTYEIKGQVNNNDYLALSARTKKSTDSHQTRVHPVVIEKSGTTHLFPKISHDVMVDGIFWKDYYIFPGQEEEKIGIEPYAINLKTWKATLLKDIRTKPWDKGSMGFVVYGSNPTTFTILDNEVLFQAELDDKTDNYATFIITEEKE